METSKKRHNPPIFDEDSAAKAFDRNNDAARTEERAVEEKSDLEKAIQTAITSQEEIIAKKGNEALREEFIYLITRIFGEDIYIMNMQRGEFEPQKQIYKEKSAEARWPLGRLKQKRRWFEFKKYEEFARISPQEKEESLFDAFGKIISKEKRILPIFENGRFNPIKITAYTPEGLRKSKLFAKAYKAFTGQDVTVVRECVDEEEMKQAGLEGVVEKTPEVKVETQSALLSDVKKVSSEDGSIEVKLSSFDWLDDFVKYLENIFAPSYKLKEKVWCMNQVYKIIDLETKQEVARVIYESTPGSNMPTRQDLTVQVYNSKVLPEVIKLSEDYKKLTGSEVSVHGNI